MQNIETEQPLDRRRREAHPERITVGDAVYERNDITAARLARRSARSTSATDTARRINFSLESNIARKRKLTSSS